MKWTRVENGTYTAGPYTVERADYHRAVWSSSGPGVSAGVGHETKAGAQAAAENAARERIKGHGDSVEPVTGDLVTVHEGSRSGIVRAVFPGTHHPIYSILLARGKRLCLERSEFQVVMP